MEKLDNILVVKVGSSTLTRENNGNNHLDKASFQRIGRQLLNLQEQGHHVVVVSSAAITAGMSVTGLTSRPEKNTKMPELQRLASIGWRHVLNEWDKALGDKTVGELLITKNELDLPTERDEVLRVTERLLAYGDIVIANENDAITHDEIAYGDNDTLAATFAAKIAQSTLFGSNVRLVLLSDIDGVYGDIDNSESIIRTISDIHAYRHLAGEAGSAIGSGGMRTKFEAAEIALDSGVETWITNGREEQAISRAFNGHIGTHFTLPLKA